MSTLNFSNVFSYREQVARSSFWGHHFLFLNLILTSLIGFVYVYAAPPSNSFVSFTYLLCSWLGQMSFLACVVYLLLLFPLSFIGSFRAYRIVSVLIAVICDTILLFDIKLYLAAKVHVSLPVLHLMFEDFDFSTGLNYNFMFLAVPAVLALQILAAKLSTRELYKSKIRNNHFPTVFCTVAVVAFLSSHGMSAWADATGYHPITAMRNVYPAHYPLTARAFLTNHGFISTVSDEGKGEPRFNYPLGDLEIDEGSVSRSHIISVFINGLSYSDLNMQDTPGLIALKSNYQSFENHYLPYPDVNDNLFAISYGLPVQYAPAFKKRHVYPVVREELFRNEYSVRLIQSAGNRSEQKNAPHGMRALNFTEVKNDEAVFAKADEISFELNDDRHLALTLALNDLMQETNAQDRRRILRRIDARLSDFIEKLRTDGVLDNALVFITSASGSPALNNRDEIFSRQYQHVPMIVIWPGGTKRALSTDIPTSHFDLAPTVGREILGIQSDSSLYSIGRNLSDLGNRKYIVTSFDNNLILIDGRSVTIYKSNGEAYTQSGENRTSINPNLEHLIGATRDLNRFIQ